MKKRLQIIVPLMAKASSKNWAKTCSLLRYSLDSAAKIDRASVSLLVVGHDRPERVTFENGCEWLQADFEPPTGDDIANKMADKGLKTRMGVQHTHQQGKAGWVMFMDADDFISNRLLRIADLQNYDAVCLSRGYCWHAGTGRLELVRGFHLKCGTSWIMQLTAANFPFWLGPASGKRVCDQSHTDRLTALQDAGARVQMLREPCAIYVSGHGANSYAGQVPQGHAPRDFLNRAYRLLKFVARRKRMTAGLRAEFSLPEQGEILR